MTSAFQEIVRGGLTIKAFLAILVTSHKAQNTGTSED